MSFSDASLESEPSSLVSPEPSFLWVLTTKPDTEFMEFVQRLPQQRASDLPRKICNPDSSLDVPVALALLSAAG